MKFDSDELMEMRSFLQKALMDSNLKEQERRLMPNGSIFFLRLGEGKYKFIEEGIETLKSGISYSFNFLNSLRKIYINGEEIRKQNVQSFSKEFIIGSPEFEFIKPRNGKRSIKFSFAYYYDYKKSELIANSKTEEYSPNFYNFFSMDEEKNGFRFLVHCNAFDMNNDRRKLQPNSQINERLLPILAKNIIEFIDQQKELNRFLHLSLYASLLLSKEPKNKQNINTYFYAYLKKYFQNNIPTEKGFGPDSDKIKIKDTRLDIDPKELGCPELEWFNWQSKFDKELVEESQKSDKLGLKEWGIIDLLKYAVQKGQLERVNSWIKQLEFESAQILEKGVSKPYLSLLREINQNASKTNFDVISQIKLLKFNDGIFYSFNEVFANENIILNNDVISPIRYILYNKLGFAVSVLDIEKSEKIYELVKVKLNNLTIFNKICAKTRDAAETERRNIKLTPEDKKKFFLVLKTLSDEDTKRIRDIEMFCDTQRNVKPIRRLLKSDSNVPSWLFAHKMNQHEDMPELQEYCVKPEEVYKNVILPNWDRIIQNERVIPKSFYPEVFDYYKLSTQKETLLSNDLSFIASYQGFKKKSEIFYNAILININRNHYPSLHDFVYKVSKKSLPQSQILQYLNDDSSPFKIDVNQRISDQIVTINDLEYREVHALLDFAKQNHEELFNNIYIEKNLDKFSVVKHKQEVFQYFSARKEINDLLSKYVNFKLFPRELNSNIYGVLGVLQDKELYLTIIQNIPFSEQLLPIVKECDKEVQLAYLSRIDCLNLLVGKNYNKNSFEHRCIKLALDCYETSFQVEFGPKILINSSLGIKDITVSDEVKFEKKTLSLATILPKYEGISDIITKIIHQFSDFAKSELSEKVFPIGTKSKSEILSELLVDFKVFTNIEQYAFVFLYSKQSGKNYLTSGLLSGLENVKILQYCFENKLEDVAAYVDFGVSGKVFPSEFGIDKEKLPEWVLSWIEINSQEKLLFLASFGVHTPNSSLLFLRKGILDSNKEVFEKGISAAIKSELLINTLDWLLLKQAGHSFSFVKSNLKWIYDKLVAEKTPIAGLPIPVLKIHEQDNYLLVKQSVGQNFHEINTGWGEMSSEIFNSVIKSGQYVIDDLLPTDYKKNLNPIVTAAITVLDSIKLIKNSVVYSEPFYTEWDQKDKYKIFLYKGLELPYQVKYLALCSKDINLGKKSDIHNGSFYITLDEREFIFEHLRALKFSAYDSLNNAKRYLEDKAKREQNEVQYSEDEKVALKRLFGNDVPENFHKDLNLAALISGLIYLSKHGFDISKAELSLKESHKKAQLNLVAQSGKTFNVMCRSAKSGILYITQRAWNRLDNEDVLLFIKTGNKEVDCNLVSSKEELIEISNTSFQVFRVRANSSVSATESILAGKFDNSKVWLVFKIKENSQYNLIFGAIRDKETSDFVEESFYDYEEEEY